MATQRTPIQILLIEDEEYDARRINNTLKQAGGRIHIREIVSNGKAALDVLRNSPGVFDVAIMDFQIAGGLMGEQLIREMKKFDASLQIIVVTKMTVNVADFAFANSLLEAGAFWYCTKYPGDIEGSIYQPTDFILSIVNAFQKRQLERAQLATARRLERNVEGILQQRTLIGSSRPIQEL
jgi:two-component system, NtrC family, response regulator AtoC